MKPDGIGVGIVLVFTAIGFFLTGREPAEVQRIHETTGAGNTGTLTAYKVELDNGSELRYEKYESYHPLCPEQPEKCGEDSKDPAFDEVENLTESSSFSEEKPNSGKIYVSEESFCLESKISYIKCP
ncbi:MAG: hypothetical protein H8Z69_00165 [Nanohaloarchaea archaeon]|nr:hypothetical protein [Candidatus Nanohaloarchaea archaeon]